MTSPGTRFRPRSDVRFRRLHPEAVVLRQEASEVMVLNEVGGRVLELLASGSTVGEATAVLAAEFAVERETLERDLTEFAGELVAARVLEEG
jgi:hypothetical protein